MADYSKPEDDRRVSGNQVDKLSHAVRTLPGTPRQFVKSKSRRQRNNQRNNIK